MPSVLTEQTQFVDDDGKPLNDGTVFFGVQNADPKASPLIVFSDRALTVAIGSSQLLDEFGRTTNKVWLSGSYSLLVEDSLGNQKYQELDNGDIVNLVEDTTPQLGGSLDPNGNFIGSDKGADIASAAATSIGTDGDFFDVTGTTTITSFAVAANRVFTLQFDAILTLTHNASALILNQDGDNIITAAGDVAVFQARAANTVRLVAYSYANGQVFIPVDQKIFIGEFASFIMQNTGDQNQIEIHSDDKDSLHISGGSTSQHTTNSFGDLEMLDQTFMKFDFANNLATEDDEVTQFTMLADTQGSCEVTTNQLSIMTMAPFKYDANADLHFDVGSSTNVEYIDGGAAPTTAALPGSLRTTAGKFGIIFVAADVSFYLVNHTGGTLKANVFFKGHGGGMQK